YLLPTTNQVSELLHALEQGPFCDVEVVEILVRRYKPVPDRLRPEDRMVAHTGFLVFARCLEPVQPPEEPPAAEAEAAGVVAPEAADATEPDTVHARGPEAEAEPLPPLEDTPEDDGCCEDAQD
ncbi:MAG: tRNA (adenine-N1)-methyltransferase, partial [Desulfovibrionaceae bacterium]